MKRRLSALLVLALAAPWGASAEEPRAKQRKPGAERAGLRCAVDERLLGPRDEFVWKGACEDGKASGKGQLSITRSGVPWRRLEGEFFAGVPLGEVAIEFANGERWQGPQRDGQPAGRGVWQLASGDQIHGRFVGGEAEGAVEIRYARGERYVGAIRDRRPHGPGEWRLADGSTLAAYFVEGDAQAPYRLRRPDGARVVGRRASLPDGPLDGTAVWQASDLASAAVFEGEFAGGGAQTRLRGVRLDPDGGWAAGDFTDFRLDGPATIRYRDGWIYRGAVRDGRPAGRGELSGTGAREGERVVGEISPERLVVGDGEYWRNDGSRFEGPLSADFAPAGQGRRYLPDGTVVAANFSLWIADGDGEVRYANGMVYRGGLRAGVPEGEGELTWPDGARYRGSFAAGLMKGSGQLTLSNGTVYRGGFLAGIASGDGELRFATGERYLGPFNNGLPEGLGEWYANSKTVVKAAYRRGLREGIALVRLDGEAAPANIALRGDLPTANEGPYFSVFKRKSEEFESLLRDGFYRWAYRYFRQNQAAFGERATDQARLLALLDENIGRLPRFQAENYRLTALLVAGNASLDPSVTEPSRVAAVHASLRSLIRDAEKDPVLAAGRFLATLRSSVEQLERQEQARLAGAVTIALAAGDFGRANRLARLLPKDRHAKHPDVSLAERTALADWLTRHPAQVESHLPALNEFWQTLGPPDPAALGARYRARFDRALAERDVADALLVWSAAAAIGVDFVDAPRRRALIDRVAWRLRARPEATPLANLLAVAGALKTGGEGDALALAWLDACTDRIAQGDLAAANALAALAARLPVPLPRALAQVAGVLEARLVAGDATSLITLWPTLRAAGVDLTGVFRGRVVLLRAGSIGGGRPFPLTVDTGGLPFAALDDAFADEPSARAELETARYAIWVDLHGRHVRRDLRQLKKQQGNISAGGRLQPYAYFDAEIALRRALPLNAYLIDLDAGTYRMAMQTVARDELFRGTLGRHPGDERPGERLDRLGLLERTPLAARLSEMLPDFGAASARPLAELVNDAAEARRLADEDAARRHGELERDLDTRLSQAAAATHPDVRLREEQTVSALRAEQALADAPERANRDLRRLQAALLERTRALAAP